MKRVQHLFTMLTEQGIPNEHLYILFDEIGRFNGNSLNRLRESIKSTLDGYTDKRMLITNCFVWDTTLTGYDFYCELHDFLNKPRWGRCDLPKVKVEYFD